MTMAKLITELSNATIADIAARIVFSFETKEEAELYCYRKMVMWLPDSIDHKFWYTIAKQIGERAK